MKALILVSLFLLSGTAAFTQNDTAKKKEAAYDTLLVDASCGECQFGLDGKGCHLAVRIDGKAYFVDGTTIDKNGDAHAKDGFCNAVRKAKVTGEVKNNRFKVRSFKLLPVAEAK